MFPPWKKSYDKSRQHIKKQRHHFADKDPYSQSYGFSSSHVWMWESDYKESWAPKSRCFWTVVLEKTLESPLDCKEIKLVNLKGNQSWISIRRTDDEAPILWPPDSNSWLIRKDPDAGEDWRQEARGNDRGQDGWIVSPTQWTWVWVGSRRWWKTGQPRMLQSMGLQRVGHDWATELNWFQIFLPSHHAWTHIISSDPWQAVSEPFCTPPGPHWPLGAECLIPPGNSQDGSAVLKDQDILL